MVTKYVNQTLGMGIGDGMAGARLIGCGVMVDASLVHQPKMWIGAALGVAGGLASSLVGGLFSSSAAKEAERRQRQQEARERAWYERRYNEDYLDTAAGQNLVRRAKEYANEQWKKAVGAQAVAGGTDAATAQAKDAGNKMMGDTIANIAATDHARKAQVDNMHRQAEQNFAQMDVLREQQRAQNITNAAQAASNVMMSAGAATDQASAKPTNLQGGGNNSKVVEQPQQTTVPVGSLSDGHQPIYEDADTLKRLMQG